MQINKNDLFKVNKYCYIYDADHPDRLIEIIDEDGQLIYKVNIHIMTRRH